MHFAALRIYNGKSVNMNSSNMVRTKGTKVPTLEYWDTVDYLLERNIIHIGFFFPTTPNLSTATEDISFLQYNEFSKVF